MCAVNNQITFHISLGGIPIAVSCLFESTKTFLKEYLTNEEVILSIIITKEDILKERELSVKNSIKEYGKIIDYPDVYLETLALLRKIAEKLPIYDRVLIHGSLISMDDKGILFTASSGTGKSTHAHLWKKLYQDRVVYVNDDKPFLQINGNSVIGYGNPWDGKHRLSNPISCPLKAICILQRGEVNTIERISVDEAYPFLLKQIYRPEQKETLFQTLALVDVLLRNIPIYRLKCNMNMEAAQIAYEGLKGVLYETK